MNATARFRVPAFVFRMIALTTAVPLSARGAEQGVDLSQAVIVTSPEARGAEAKAAVMLAEEIEKRTQLRIARTHRWPTDPVPAIAIGQADFLQSLPNNRTPRQGAARPIPAEGYSISLDGTGAAPVVQVLGADPRGVLFGAGRLLRELRLDRRRVQLPTGFAVRTSPQKSLRGHQLGYRPKTNSYDGWSVDMWEQYIRELAVFGCNAVELLPPRTDDDSDSPHFPLSQADMIREMSRIADEYNMDVWVWYPALDTDYSQQASVTAAVREWGDVLQSLPRLDAIFVPGGDPGRTPPSLLLNLLEQQARNIRRLHPKAQMWVSPQSFTAAQSAEFFSLLATEPTWLTGIALGPQIRFTNAELRRRVPGRYPLRDYPDITHSRHCQYVVPDWDTAFARTEGRETINPRPLAMASIYRGTQSDTAGFITYSEGCNDDVNKVIWSGLGWDEGTDVNELLRQYGRYFICPAFEERFAQGILALEKNWVGPLAANAGVEETLREFQAMERSASPRVKQSWRFQMAVYRAYYDAFLRRRLLHETAAQDHAMEKLRAANSAGSLAAMEEAEKSLNQPLADAEAMAWRARVFELAEALFQSIHLQLSVPRYQAIAVERGANLDSIDATLNDRAYLAKRFGEIRRMSSEPERRAALQAIIRWTDPGPGGFYDDLGSPGRQPHLVRGPGHARDPSHLKSSLIGFLRDPNTDLPRTWWDHAETLYEQPLEMRYTGLDPSAQYTLRVVYAAEPRRPSRIRLTANGTTEVHPYLTRPYEILEFAVPKDATKRGELRLSWNQEPGGGGAGRGCQVAEAWLIKKER